MSTPTARAASAQAHEAHPVDAPLPWDHVDAGVSKRFLMKERERAFAGALTEDCTFGACTACGICESAHSGIVVQEERGGHG